MEVNRQNLKRLFAGFAALSDLGPTLTAERDFSETAPHILRTLMDATAVREAALFRFTDRPSMLMSLGAEGFPSFPKQAVLPLTPMHVHNWSRLQQPTVLTDYNEFFTASGNFPPRLFRCIVPLRVLGKFVGAIALGLREEDALYGPGEIEVLSLLAHYIGLGVHNYTLSETLAQRVSENIKLVATVHSFYDNTLEAFAAAIDFKHVNIHGHSLRVGRYAAGIAEALGIEDHEIAGIRAAGYLHDIGKVAIDKALFGKPSSLAPDEFREMADHTTMGYEIVQNIEFPWPRIPEVVRWHHERADGSGYPDRLPLMETNDSVRVVALADTFDAMTSQRPYRQPMSVGMALSELVRLTPQKYDPNTLQALLIQIRRDVTTKTHTQGAAGVPRFLDERLASISPMDIDHLASALHHKLTGGRTYSA